MKIKLLPLIAMMFFGGASSTAFADEGKAIEAGDPFVVDADRGLNVRKAPNTRRVGAIPHGQVVYATGPSKKVSTGKAGMQDWLPVRYQNESNEWVEGWIYLRHAARSDTPEVKVSGASDSNAGLTTSPSRGAEVAREALGEGSDDTLKQDAADPGAVAAANTSDKILLNVSVRTKARFRSSPSFGGKILGRLGNDTEVEVVGKSKGDWIPIRVPGTQETGWMHASLLEADGDFNPLEVADTHKETSDVAGKLISDYAKQIATEAGIKETCEDCDVTKSESGRLDRLPVASGKDYVYPVNGPINSRFGLRRDPINGNTRHHGGVDFRVPTGTRVSSIRGGRVIAVKNNCRVGNRRCGSGWGNHVIVDHGNGIVSVYAHLQSSSVKRGDRVTQGQQIARSGNTGRSTGPHLHFEIQRNGQKVNPLNYIKK